MLHADELVVGYVAGVDILRGCSIDVAGGELVGIIGPNGAGKSTLIKSLFGLVPVRQGTVLLDGEDITSRSAHELVQAGVGYVPQVNNVFPSLTISENLEMGSYSAAPAVQGAVRRRHRAVPAAPRAHVASPPDRCRAASARCWPWPAP